MRERKCHIKPQLIACSMSSRDKKFSLVCSIVSVFTMIKAKFNIFGTGPVLYLCYIFLVIMPHVMIYRN